MRIYRQNSFFVEQKGVLVKKYKSELPCHSHTHDFIELLFVVKGEGVHTIDGVDYDFCPGSFFAVDKLKSHSIVPKSHSEYYNVFLTEEYARSLELFIEESAKVSAVVYFDRETQLQLEGFFEGMLSEYNSKGELWEELAREYLKLVLLFRTRFSRKGGDSRKIKMSGAALPRVIEYLNKNYSSKITLTELAGIYGYNSAYLGRLFRSTYKMSFNEYLRGYRLDLASELLITTDMNLEKIAAQVGFGNNNCFYKGFCSRFGCTPAQFRRNERKKDGEMAAKKGE